MSWSRKFEDPIAGIVTLEDAANHILKLPKAEQSKAHWQAAAEMLMKVAEQGYPVMFADIGMRRALDHGNPELVKEPRRKAVKKMRIIR